MIATAAQAGLGLLSWDRESFAYADGYDEATGRYRGLRCGQQITVTLDGGGLLIKPEVALRQQAAETSTLPGPTGGPTNVPPSGQPNDPTGDGITSPAAARLPKRFHGTVTLDPNRVGRDAGRIADEVISHLVGLMGADVTVTLEIQAGISSGAPDNVVRTVTENARTLKFKSQGFEED